MLVELTEDSDRIVVHASYVEKDAVRAIPGSSWERDRWTVPRTWAACLRGDFKSARETHDRMLPLHVNLFVEASPAPTKYALSLLGKCSEEVRLPIVPLSDNARSIVRNSMARAGLI